MGGGGGIPCDTGFNSPTERIAENIVIWEILDWVFSHTSDIPPCREQL